MTQERFQELDAIVNGSAQPKKRGSLSPERFAELERMANGGSNSASVPVAPNPQDAYKGDYGGDGTFGAGGFVGGLARSLSAPFAKAGFSAHKALFPDRELSPIFAGVKDMYEDNDYDMDINSWKEGIGTVLEGGANFIGGGALANTGFKAATSTAKGLSFLKRAAPMIGQGALTGSVENLGASLQDDNRGIWRNVFDTVAGGAGGAVAPLAVAGLGNVITGLGRKGFNKAAKYFTGNDFAGEGSQYIANKTGTRMNDLYSLFHDFENSKAGKITDSNRSELSKSVSDHFGPPTKDRVKQVYNNILEKNVEMKLSPDGDFQFDENRMKQIMQDNIQSLSKDIKKESDRIGAISGDPLFDDFVGRLDGKVASGEMTKKNSEYLQKTIMEYMQNEGVLNIVMDKKGVNRSLTTLSDVFIKMQSLKSDLYKYALPEKLMDDTIALLKKSMKEFSLGSDPATSPKLRKWMQYGLDADSLDVLNNLRSNLDTASLTNPLSYTVGSAIGGYPVGRLFSVGAQKLQKLTNMKIKQDMLDNKYVKRFVTELEKSGTLDFMTKRQASDYTQEVEDALEKFGKGKTVEQEIERITNEAMARARYEAATDATQRAKSTRNTKAEAQKKAKKQYKDNLRDDKIRDDFVQSQRQSFSNKPLGLPQGKNPVSERVLTYEDLITQSIEKMKKDFADKETDRLRNLKEVNPFNTGRYTSKSYFGPKTPEVKQVQKVQKEAVKATSKKTGKKHFRQGPSLFD